MTNNANPTTIAETYFTSWRAGDLETLRSVLADDVTFVGPLATLDNGDDCARSLGKLAESTTDITVRHRFVDGDDVLTWFDLRVNDLAATPVANWMHVEGGRITSIRVTFDPREMLAG
jgi:ketosteroid isomerase-like protein